jgi:hypothetical protein
MNKQSVIRVLGFIFLFLVIVGQFFKNETQFLQPYIPYLIIVALLFLSISLYLKTKAEGVNSNLKVKFVLMFISVVISVLILIYYLTTK